MANLALPSVAQICRKKYLSMKFNTFKLRREKLTARFQKTNQMLVQLAEQWDRQSNKSFTAKLEVVFN